MESIRLPCRPILEFSRFMGLMQVMDTTIFISYNISLKNVGLGITKDAKPLKLDLLVSLLFLLPILRFLQKSKMGRYYESHSTDNMIVQVMIEITPGFTRSCPFQFSNEYTIFCCKEISIQFYQALDGRRWENQSHRGIKGLCHLRLSRY